MQRFEHHLCLISKEPTPNLTPILDDRFKPAFVHMVVAPEMGAYARALAETIKPTGVKVSFIEIDDAFDLEHILAKLLDWASEHDHFASVALNITGGTKPMAIAAQEVFRTWRRDIFYVNPVTDSIQILGSDSRFDLQNKVKLRAYLQAHRFQVTEAKRPDSPRAEKELTEYLLATLDNQSEGIGLLNFYAQDARDSLVSQPMRDKHLANQGFQAILDKLIAAGLLKVIADKLHFTNESARFFCNGGWLEQFIYSKICDIKSKLGIHDIALSLQLEASSGSPNEIDIAFLADNRLFLIECKTKRFQTEGDGKPGTAAEPLYKLDSHKAFGGLNTQGMLVTYRQLRKSDEIRTKDLGIKVVSGKSIHNFAAELESWVEPFSRRKAKQGLL